MDREFLMIVGIGLFLLRFHCNGGSLKTGLAGLTHVEGFWSVEVMVGPYEK